jgi:hypothetical protein
MSHAPSRSPATTTLVSPFAPTLPIAHGGAGTAENCRIADALRCGGMATALRAMQVDLRAMLDDAGWLPVTAATDFAIEFCEKLAAIHDAGTEAGEGVSSLDPGADIEALGVVLYELLGGDASVRSDLPIGLQSVVLRCLKRDQAGRIPDAPSLAIALAPYASPAGQQRARRLQHPSRGLPGIRIYSVVGQEPRLGSLRPSSPPALPGPRGTVRLLAPARETPATGSRASEAEPASALTPSLRVWLGWVAASLAVIAVAYGVAPQALRGGPLHTAPAAEVTAPMGVANRMPDVPPAAEPPAPVMPAPRTSDVSPVPTPPASEAAPVPAPTASEHIYQPEELPIATEVPPSAPAKVHRATAPRSHPKPSGDRIGLDTLGF